MARKLLFFKILKKKKIVIYFKLHRNRDMLNDNKVKHSTNESIKGFYPISV